jgi:hypothetical protein
VILKLAIKTLKRIPTPMDFNAHTRLASSRAVVLPELASASCAKNRFFFQTRYLISITRTEIQHPRLQVERAKKQKKDPLGLNLLTDACNQQPNSITRDRRNQKKIDTYWRLWVVRGCHA